MGKDLDKFRGCLIGGAAGDALGYAVEFMSSEEIFIRYGEKGITELQLTDGLALISDDTQMTLFTGCGLLHGTTMQQTGGPFESYPAAMAVAYRDWLRTQEASTSKGSISWLNNVPGMNSRRAPGNTCLSALSSGICGRIAAPVNDSKGCGGVMRVAPVGLYLQSIGLSLYDADMIAAEAAAVTHGHPLGYMPAAALAQIIGYAVNMPDSPLLYSVMSAKHALGKLFPDEPELTAMTALIDKAIELSLMDMDDLDAIRQLGEGWTGDECLAIAIYCALKYSDNFEEALIASVNHDGDSDSTGAVTGNILGAFLGMNAIPAKFTESLELKDVIIEIADDLCNDCPISYEDVMEDKVWVSKYLNHDYVPGQAVDMPEEKSAEEADEPFSETPLQPVQMELDLDLFAPQEPEIEPEDAVPQAEETVSVPEPEPKEEPVKQEAAEPEDITLPAEPGEQENTRVQEIFGEHVDTAPLQQTGVELEYEPTKDEVDESENIKNTETDKTEAGVKAETDKSEEVINIETDKTEAEIKPAAKPRTTPKAKSKPSPESKHEPKSTPLVLKKIERKEKPAPAAPEPKKTVAEPKQKEKETARQPLIKPTEPGKIRFFKWTDPSFGGYDILAACDRNAYLNLCISFEGCRMDALCEEGQYYFLIDNDWKEITPLRKAEYLHPDNAPSPKGDPLKKYPFNAAAFDYRVYTDKELK